MSDVVKDLTAGTFGGAAQLVMGHPFDTVKVRLQSQGYPPKYKGAIDVVRQMLASEGPKGFFKGMGAPLATVAAFNALLFSVRGRTESLLRPNASAHLTVLDQAICGAVAGLAVSFLACPTELIKCRLQARSVSSATGPIDVVKGVLRSEGGPKGLFKGMVPTLAREVPGNAVLFGVYEALKQSFVGGRDTSGLGKGPLVVAGGLAGACFWLAVYPADLIKSVVQTDDHLRPKYDGTVDAMRKIIVSEGVRGLYKGFAPAMARSVPANAACFLAYEAARSALR